MKQDTTREKIAAMTVGQKIGGASIASACISVVGGPIGFSLAVISCVLGFIAAQRSSKWWLAVPCTVAGIMAVLMYIGFHAE